MGLYELGQAVGNFILVEIVNGSRWDKSKNLNINQSIHALLIQRFSEIAQVETNAQI